MFSPNELEVMELLWSVDRSLTRSEIIDLSPNKSWKASTIHQLLNSMLKKEAIKVDGFKQTGKNYGRTFSAAITREEYTIQELNQHLPQSASSNQVNLVGIFAAMVNNTKIDKETLKELQHILDEKERMLGE